MELMGLREGARMARGFSLLELLVVLALAGLALAVALPAARRLTDQAAVDGARESVAGALHWARMEAVAQGVARVTLQAHPPRVELWSGGTLRSARELDEDFGVQILLSRNRTSAEILFDPMGLGRIASQSIHFRRNGAEASLIVSSFGRATRR